PAGSRSTGRQPANVLTRRYQARSQEGSMAVTEEPQVEGRNASYWCDIDAFRASPLTTEPFPYTIVPRFIRARAMRAVEADFPTVTRVGSFPLPSLKYGPAFGAMIDALRGPEFTSAVE